MAVILHTLKNGLDATPYRGDLTGTLEEIRRDGDVLLGGHRSFRCNHTPHSGPCHVTAAVVSRRTWNAAPRRAPRELVIAQNWTRASSHGVRAAVVRRRAADPHAGAGQDDIVADVDRVAVHRKDALAVPCETLRDPQRVDERLFRGRRSRSGRRRTHPATAAPPRRRRCRRARGPAAGRPARPRSAPDREESWEFSIQGLGTVGAAPRHV